ncbi:MAG: POTRA domain-containing protein, partial [SAR324 cluster bacterium]|nr:POTRA domain-containing protein [SAR324 cluster bacterium]
MLRGGGLAVLLACLPSFALGQSYLIQDIEISGTSDLEVAQILHQLDSQVGDPLDRRNIRKDLHTIYEMGLFVDAHAEVESVKDGYRLRFVVQERPRLVEVNVTGIVQVSKDQTLGKLTIKALDFYDPLKVEQNIEIIRNEYRKKGFLRV